MDDIADILNRIRTTTNLADLSIEDLHIVLIADEIDENIKKEVVNLLGTDKIKELRNKYSDLDYILNQIQIRTFNELETMKEKQDFFDKLSDEEKRSLINSDEILFFKNFYSHYPNKEELLDLMNQENLENLYRMVVASEREFISHFLIKKEVNLEGAIKEESENIERSTQNINKYNQENIKSEENIVNLIREKNEIRLKIKNSKVVIKDLEKRKARLEKKLSNTTLKKSSRIAFISKRRLARIQQLNKDLNDYQEKLTSIKDNIKQEKSNIDINKKNIELMNQSMQISGQNIRDIRVRIKKISKFNQKNLGRKVYNHNKNEQIAIVSKEKLDKLAKNVQETYTRKEQETTESIDNTEDINAKKHQNNSRETSTSPNSNSNQGTSSSSDTNSSVEQTDQPINQSDPKVTSESKTSQNLNNFFEAMAQNGIHIYPEASVSPNQVFSNILEQPINSISANEAKMLRLYFEALYIKKMAEIYQMQEKMSINQEESKDKSKSLGFSNSIILSLSLFLTFICIIIMLLLSR